MLYHTSIIHSMKLNLLYVEIAVLSVGSVYCLCIILVNCNYKLKCLKGLIIIYTIHLYQCKLLNNNKNMTWISCKILIVCNNMLYTRSYYNVNIKESQSRLHFKTIFISIYCLMYSL